MNIQKLVSSFLAFAVTLGTFSGCAQGAKESAAVTDKQTENVTEAAAETKASETAEPKIKAIYGEIRTEFNENLDLSDHPLTPSDVPADYNRKYEAEDGELKGEAKAVDGGGLSSGSCVTGVNKEGDSLTFKVDCEYTGFYDLTFYSMGDDGRVDYVYIDGEQAGDITTHTKESFGGTGLLGVYFEKGAHDVEIRPYWGYVTYDYLEMTAGSAVTEDTYKITKPLSNPNADDNTKRLYNFLCDIYGKYSLAGQYADKGRASKELERIKQATGKEFSVVGLDFMGYDSTSQSHGDNPSSVEYAYDWYANGGGIVQMLWHWRVPGKFCKNDENNPWYSAFYKEGTTISLDKVMNGEDEEGYQLLMDDIDLIGTQLERLRDEGVPILWRPLHEASGGWFWWGNCSPESYKKLWNAMYDRLTNGHNLTNLIWVWNGQSPEWYPGDETVDIIGWDIYQGNHVYTSQSGRFNDMAKNYGTERKLIAITENGCVPDPELTFRDNARWLFWGTWSDPFTLKMKVVLNDEYTETEALVKAYTHDRVLTLDELPDLKNYRVES